MWEPSDNKSDVIASSEDVWTNNNMKMYNTSFTMHLVQYILYNTSCTIHLVNVRCIL